MAEDVEQDQSAAGSDDSDKAGTASGGGGRIDTERDHADRRWLAARWHAIGSRARVLAIGAAALVVVLAIAVPVVVTRDDGEPLAAERTADRVPHGPIVTDVPFACGMTRSLVASLVPGAPMKEGGSSSGDSCSWESGDIAWSLGGANRKLDIDIRMGMGGEASSPIGNVLDTFRRMLTKKPDPGSTFGKAKTVPGLGRDAVLWSVTDESGPVLAGEDKPEHVVSRDSGARVIFRAGNIAASVTYTGGYYGGAHGKKYRPLSTKDAQTAVLRAASRAARSMNLPVAHPSVRPIAGDPQAAPIPAACKLVPRPMAERLAGSPAKGKPQLYGLLFAEDADDVESSSCDWSGRDGSLMVSLSRASATRYATGVDRARRRFLGFYTDARHAHSMKPDVAFAALRGLGDRTFLAGDTDATKYSIMFRSGSTLVRVSMFVDEMSPDEALERAYEAASAVAKKVGQR